MNKYIIITTINPPNDAIKKFARLDGWKLIVVGDKKTPTDWNNDDAIYLDLNQQTHLFDAFSQAIPLNNYARKNIGYLYAMMEGADIIAESDDDNEPLSYWDKYVFPDSLKLKTLKEPKVANIYNYFTKKNRIWPRGFPLELILKKEPLKITDDGPKMISIMQYLVHGEPDVDAIYRLTNNRPVKFKNKQSLVIDKNVFVPFNSQNTMWKKLVFPVLYMPSLVTIRLTDILRGWVAQRCIWDLDQHLAFGRPTVFQKRNEHNLLQDFEHELPCYLDSMRICNALLELKLSKDVCDNLFRCYKKLSDLLIVPSKELNLIEKWLNLVSKVS